MPSLSEYVNVYDSVLEVLRKKGFWVWMDEHTDMFCAEKDGWDFMAENPISLLGLVALFEHLGPDTYKEYWWKLEGPLDYQTLPKKPPDYIPIWKK